MWQLMQAATVLFGSITGANSLQAALPDLSSSLAVLWEGHYHDMLLEAGHLVNGLYPPHLLAPGGGVHGEALGPGVDHPAVVHLALPLGQEPHADLVQGQDVLPAEAQVPHQDGAIH